MFDIGWGEFVVIGAVALVVIGPKELPGVLRTVGGAVSKLKRMAGDFQQQFNDAIRESEFEEARKAFDGANNSISSGSAFNPIQTIRDEIKNAVEGSAPSTTAVSPAPTPDSTPALPAVTDVQATAPDPIIDIPPPPPVPDLTPEQIHAAFAGTPTSVPVETAAEESPTPRRRRARKADAANAEATAVVTPSDALVTGPDTAVEPATEKPKRRTRKAKTTDDGEAAG